MRSEALLASLLFASVSFAANRPELPQPTLPPPTAWRAPVPASSTASGVRVVVLPERDLPLVHVMVTVQAGSALDPPDRPGLAALTARMIEEGGAGARTGSELAAAIDDLGAELEVDVQEEGARFSLTVMSTRLERALGIIGDVLARPRFDAAEWPSIRARHLSEIIAEHDKPTRVASDVFMKVLYGDHPYGHSPLGTRDAVEKMTLDEVKQFWKSHYGPRATSVILIGDASVDGAQKLVTSTFGNWSSKASPPAPPRPPVSPSQTRLVLVDRPGAPQSAFQVGRLGISWASPDYAAASLLETVLGGSFTSRLTQNLREKHGYTYGVHDNFDVERATGPYQIVTEVRTDATGDALKEILHELDAIRAPLPADELQKGRALVAQRVIEVYGEGSMLSQALAELVLGDQSLDLYAKLQGELDRLTSQNVAQVAERLFPPSPWTIVIVGDRKVIEPQLRALPVGKFLELRDSEGNPVR